jgi:hypothetical protein
MDETERRPEKVDESGESRSSEQQDLENATLDPRASVEQSGDIRQAEEVQESFARVVENTEEQVGRQPRTAEGPFEQVSTSGEDGGEQATPINLLGPEDVGATPLPIPNVARDVGATPLPIPNVAQDVGATPLPIPNVAQDVGATPLPIPRPEDEILTGKEPVLRGDQPAEVGRAIQTPEILPQEANFEKPILNQEAENLDSGLDTLGAVDSLPSGPGILDGESGSEDIGFMDFGGAGYEAATKFLAGFESPIGPTGVTGNVENQGGARPAAPTGTSGNVESPGSTNTQTGSQSWNSGTDSKPFTEHENQDSSGQSAEDVANDFMNYCKDAYDSGDQPQDGDVSGWVAGKAAEYFSGKSGDGTLTKILRSLAGDKPGAGSQTKTTVTRIKTDDDDDDGGDDGGDEGGDDDDGDDDGDEGGDDDGGEDDDGDDGDDDGEDDDDWDDGDDDGGEDDDGDDGDDDGGDDDDDLSEEGDDPSKMQKAPINSGPSQKSDQDQISNYPEDHIAGNQGGGMLNEEHAEALKRTLDNKAKLANTTPKVGAEQITDPPEPAPDKKSETTGKSG